MNVPEIVASALREIRDRHVREAATSALVVPETIELTFEYADPSDQRACWVVARAASTQIVYCPAGFGADKWGVIPVGEGKMGRDDTWFASFEDAFLNSGLWLGALPLGYQVS